MQQGFLRGAALQMGGKFHDPGHAGFPGVKGAVDQVKQ